MDQGSGECVVVMGEQQQGVRAVQAQRVEAPGPQQAPYLKRRLL